MLMTDCGASTSIQQPVQLLDGELVGQLLGFLEVVDADESVFDLCVSDAFLIELPGKVSCVR